MSNYKTSAQRYNDRMEKIWEKAKQSQKQSIFCDNTDHDPRILSPVSKVLLTDDFGGITCHWCANCQERNSDMILLKNL